MGSLDQCLFLPSTISYLGPHYEMNEEQNQDSSFGNGKDHDLGHIYNLVDGLIGNLGLDSVKTVETFNNLHLPLGLSSGLQTFPGQGFNDNLSLFLSLVNGDGSILPSLWPPPLAPQFPVIGWELLPSGPMQMVVCRFIFLVLLQFLTS